MTKPCFHCGQTAGPLVADQICLACTADATYGRMQFSTYRYLAPPESAGVGDEHRDDPVASDWKVVINDFLPLAERDRGLYRRKIRSADVAQRYLDPGEALQQGDLGQDTQGAYYPLPEVPDAKVADPFAYRRPLYAQFPPSLCLCPEDKRAALPAASETPESPAEPPAAACLTCGRIWADVTHPDLEVTQATRDFTAKMAEYKLEPCTCDTVDVIPIAPPDGRPNRDQLRQAVPFQGESLLKIRAALGLPEPFEAPTEPVRLKVKCRTCGAIYTAEAWHARRSAYPDLVLSDREMIRATLRSYATGPVQLSSTNRYLLKAQKHRWESRLRRGVSEGLSEETAKAVDAEIERALAALKKLPTAATWKEADPVLTMDAVTLVDYVKDALDLLEETFKVEIEKAYNARFEVIDETLIKYGGKPYFFAEVPDEPATWTQPAWLDPPDPPEPLPGDIATTALLVVADALRPVYKANLQAMFQGEDADKKTDEVTEKASYKRVLQLVGNLPGPVLRDHLETLEKDGPKDTLAILRAMVEHISPFEDSYAKTAAPDLSDLVGAVTPSGALAIKKEDWQQTGPLVHVLTPGDEIRPGDGWNDEGILRPVIATIGKIIPGLAVLEAASSRTGMAVPGVSIFCRAVGYEYLPTKDPDAIREMFAYNALGGREPTTDAVLAVDAVAHLAHLAGRPVSASDIEAAVRLLYTAAGLDILECTTQGGVVYVTIKTPMGPRRIGVPVPPPSPLSR